MDNKTRAFEYFVYQVHRWYKEDNSSSENDLSILKILKLLFFVTAVDTVDDQDDLLLDEIFNNFVAMPYGHVESFIYSQIKKGLFNNISINKRESKILNERSILETPTKIQEKIDSKVQSLKLINKNIIRYSSFDLVEISHKWYSWKKNFEIAKQNHSFSYPIDRCDIKKEVKFYF